jgi:chemotaxis protein CheD
VAAGVWDPDNGIGGATHFLLPSWDEKGLPSARYGSVAVSVLLQKLAEAGADRGQLRAKVFGGGCLFGFKPDGGTKPGPDLGSRNVEIAVEMLCKARIPVVSKEVSGERGQRVVFQTHTGEAEVKSL